MRALQQKADLPRRRARDLLHHLRVDIRVAANDAHALHAEHLRQRQLDARERPPPAADRPCRLHEALPLRGQLHAGGTLRQASGFFQRFRRRAHLPLRQMQPRGQGAPADGLQRRDALQNQRAQLYLLHQIRRNQGQRIED